MEWSQKFGYGENRKRNREIKMKENYDWHTITLNDILSVTTTNGCLREK